MARRRLRSKRTPVAPERGEMALSMVLLPVERGLSPAELRDEYLRCWPAGSMELSSRSQDPHSTMIEVAFDECIGMISMVPVPVPGDVANVATRSWLWSGDTRALRDHVCHLLVVVVGGDDVAKRFAAASRLVAVVALLTEAAGVYVGGADMVIPPHTYREIAEFYDPQLADMLWVNTIASPRPDGGVRVATEGLVPFGALELEIGDSSRPVGELREFILQIAGYLTEHGPVVNDGDTVGRTATERYRVSVGNSSFDADRQVMRIIGY